jgi:hypothetical protein
MARRSWLALAGAAAAVASMDERSTRADASCQVIDDRVAEAQDAVRRFYRCLLGDNSDDCKALLSNANSPYYGARKDAGPLGNVWAYLREHSSLLAISRVEKPEDVSRLRMRLDVSPGELRSFGNITLIVPDMSSLKKCGVMKEVSIPILRREDQKPRVVIVEEAIKVNGFDLLPSPEQKVDAAVWRRVLCPLNPDSDVKVP